MNIAQLQKQVLAGARVVLNNPNLSVRHLIEWGASEQVVREGRLEGETVVYLPDPGVWLCVFERHDRREVHPLQEAV